MQPGDQPAPVKKQPVLKLAKLIKPNLLTLVLSTVSKQPDSTQIEFIHYVLHIVDICVQNPDLRQIILHHDLPGMKGIVTEVKQKPKEEVATPVSESGKSQKEDEKTEDGAQTPVEPKE